MHHLVPHLAIAPGAYGLVGMGAVFAAAARAPITALLIIFELTGNYGIILPLMFAIVVATALANTITPDTIYTLKLRRRGIDIAAPRGSEVMRDVTVRDATGRAPRALSPNQPLSEVIARFAAERSDSLPVLEAVQALAATEDDGIPVLAPDEAHIVGWLTHRRLLRTYRTQAAVNGRGWRHWRSRAAAKSGQKSNAANLRPLPRALIT